MDNKYQVWLKARHPKTLAPVATLLVFSHEDRLRAEGIVEAAQQQQAFADVADVLRIWHPGCLIDVEMMHPGLYSVPRKQARMSALAAPYSKHSDECRMGVSHGQQAEASLTQWRNLGVI